MSLIVDGYNNKMRDMGADELDGQLIILLPQIAKEYGATKGLSDHILNEMIEVVMKFNYIGIEEIREAYRQWATNQSDPGKGAEMYSGSVNAAQIGKVLAAYVKERNKNLGLYLSQLQNSIRDKENKDRKERMKQEFEDNFIDTVKEQIKTIEDWREIPLWWYKSIKERNWIEFKEGEAQQIFEDAKDLVKIEIENEKAQALKEGINFKMPESGTDTLQKQIARKLTIFRKIVKNEKWK